MTATATETIALEELSIPIPCESGYEARVGFPPHEAHWYAMCSCAGHDCSAKAICERRRAECYRADGWICKPGCEHDHTYEEIRWVPIN